MRDEVNGALVDWDNHEGYCPYDSGPMFNDSGLWPSLPEGDPLRQELELGTIKLVYCPQGHEIGVKVKGRLVYLVPLRDYYLNEAGQPELSEAEKLGLVRTGLLLR